MKIAVDLEKPLKAKSKAELVKTAVEIYTSLVVDAKYALRPRELEFFVGCVLAYHDGIDLTSRQFLEYMIEKCEFSKDIRQIYNFRNILVKKSWLRSNGDTLKLPALFTKDIDKLIVTVVVES